MASSPVDQPSANLLSLPIELRREILRYALIASCAPSPLLASKIPNGIKLLWASDFIRSPRHEVNSEVYGYWGQEQMSRILRVNHQLLSETLEVLYAGDFVFEFSNTTRLGNVRFWLDALGEKRGLVRQIAVSVVVDLKMLSVIAHAGKLAATNTIRDKKDAWACLRRELEGLESVRVELGFVRMMDDALMGMERVVGELMALIGIFEGVKRLAIDGSRMTEERVTILQKCNKMMGIGNS